MDARIGREAPTDLLVGVRPPSRHGAPRRRYGSPRVSRRPALLLAALLAGGIGSAGLTLTSAPAASAEATSVLEAQQALLAEDEGLEVMPQASVTVAEAQARLQEVATSGGNVFDELMKAARVCSLGQLTDAFFEVGGQYRRNM